MKTIYITGISGTGKSTVAQKLQEKGHPAYDIESITGICYWRNLEGERVLFPDEVTQEFQNNHEWFCNVESYMMKHEEDLIILCGPPMKQDGFYDAFDKVLLLQCSEEVFLERLINRDNNEYGKNEDVRNSIVNWYKKFEAKMISGGALTVNTDVSIEEVVENIEKIIGE